MIESVSHTNARKKTGSWRWSLMTQKQEEDRNFKNLIKTFRFLSSRTQWKQRKIRNYLILTKAAKLNGRCKKFSNGCPPTLHEEMRAMEKPAFYQRPLPTAWIANTNSHVSTLSGTEVVGWWCGLVLQPQNLNMLHFYVTFDILAKRSAEMLGFCPRDKQQLCSKLWVFIFPEKKKYSAKPLDIDHWLQYALYLRGLLSSLLHSVMQLSGSLAPSVFWVLLRLHEPHAALRSFELHRSSRCFIRFCAEGNSFIWGDGPSWPGGGLARQKSRASFWYCSVGLFSL